MRQSLSVLMLASCCVASCCVACGSGGGELDPAVVNHLPDGDALGAAASGTYRLRLTTRACSGACPTLEVLGFTVSTCKVGGSETETVVLTQSGGHLRADVKVNGARVPLLSGGLFSDGEFDVGGAGVADPHLVEPLATGALDYAARAQGTLTPAGQVSGEVRLLIKGTLLGTSLSCQLTEELAGSREAGSRD